MIYTTILRAIDPKDGKLKVWEGPRIEAISIQDAQFKIKDRGYLTINGLLISEVDENGDKTDFVFWN